MNVNFESSMNNIISNANDIIKDLSKKILLQKLGSKLYTSGNPVDGVEMKNSIEVIKTYEVRIKQYKTEIMIYNAVMKNNKDIYKILQTRYEELICENYELTSNLVELNEINELEYINICNENKERRDNINSLCYCASTDYSRLIMELKI